MEESQKNIVAILVLATVAFLAYYFFVQRGQSDLALTAGTASEEMFVDVQRYIERRGVLDGVKMDTAIFTDERFRSLVGYPREIEERPTGRTNPFDEV
jgi:hypothetical protein